VQTSKGDIFHKQEQAETNADRRKGANREGKRERDYSEGRRDMKHDMQ